MPVFVGIKGFVVTKCIVFTLKWLHISLHDYNTALFCILVKLQGTFATLQSTNVKLQVYCTTMGEPIVKLQACNVTM